MMILLLQIFLKQYFMPSDYPTPREKNLHYTITLHNTQTHLISTSLKGKRICVVLLSLEVVLIVTTQSDSHNTTFIFTESSGGSNASKLQHF